MPSLITHEEYVAWLRDHFPSVVLLEPYGGAMAQQTYFCTEHKLEFSSSRNNFQIQFKKGKAGASLCPLCVQARRPVGVVRVKKSAHIDPAQIQDMLDGKFGKGRITLTGKYRGKANVTTFKCSRCGATQKSKPAVVLARVYACSCERTLALIPFARLSDREKTFLCMGYTALHLSVHQLSTLTGVAVSTVRVVLRHCGVYGRANSTNGKRRTLETSNLWVAVDFRTYKRFAMKLMGHMYRAYSDILDPDGLRGRDYHVDHRLSCRDAYLKYTTPLPLDVLNHPANLKLLPSAVNISKSHRSSVTLAKLKLQIKKFEARHGVVTFPEHLQLKFTQRNTVVSHSTRGLRVLGFDPGVANFGVFGGVLHGVKSIKRVSPIVSTMLRNTIRSLTGDFSDNLSAFRSEVENHIRRVNPDVVVIERFQSRGLRGPVVELVSFMIGAISGIVARMEEELGHHIVLKVVVASQWKNEVNRSFGLDTLYSQLKPTQYHRLDAFLMSMVGFPSEGNRYSAFTKDRQQKIVNFIAENPLS